MMGTMPGCLLLLQQIYTIGQNRGWHFRLHTMENIRINGASQVLLFASMRMVKQLRPGSMGNIGCIGATPIFFSRHRMTLLTGLRLRAAQVSYLQCLGLAEESSIAIWSSPGPLPCLQTAAWY